MDPATAPNGTQARGTPGRSRASPAAPPETPPLLPHHLRQLREGSGLPDDVIAERQYRSVTDPGELRRLGFRQRGLTVPGLLVPLWGPDGGNGHAAYRADVPRRPKAKYELPAGACARLDVPPRCRDAVRRPDVPLHVVEGPKKADALAAAGRCAVSVQGVWMWLGTNEYGAITTLPEWRDVALKGREVRIVYDSDAAEKPGVFQAMAALRAWLKTRGARVRAIALPAGPSGEKVGADDYLLTHTAAQLEALADEAEPAPPVLLEWLDAPPPTLTRPLALVEGRAYAATWVHVRRTEHDEATGRPRTVTRQELVLVRDDGRVFGPGGAPPDELGLEVRLPAPVRERHVWRAPAVRAFRDGRRPDAAGVFRRAVEVFDHYLDFPAGGAGLAGQRETCELSACLAVATWLTPAMTVLGYPWPNGPAGSGKTKWAFLWTRLGFLGELILSSGTFASIRDLADYGGALAFDDAEQLADPRKSDPTIRELLLAGHHAGAVVPVKEPTPEGGWRTRYVDTFAPRCFTAIRLPDPVLASRSLLIPLVRTASEKANREPAEVARWPHDQRALQDDLYALALTLLPAAPAVWAALEGETGAVGRDFEPWRQVLLVARLLERAGVGGLAGLEGRMRADHGRLRRREGRPPAPRPLRPRPPRPAPPRPHRRHRCRWW